MTAIQNSESREPYGGFKNFRRFNQLKIKMPKNLILIRVGDFYETYYQDAAIVSQTCRLPIVTDSKICMTGFVYHQLDVYLPMLIRAGYSVAIQDDDTKNPLI